MCGYLSTPWPGRSRPTPRGREATAGALSSGSRQGGPPRAAGVPSLLFEGDLTSGGCGLIRRSPPSLMRSSCSFEAVDQQMGTGDRLMRARVASRGGTPARLTRACKCSPGLVEFGRVGPGRVGDDGLLAGVEVGELDVVEVSEAAGEVAVGLESGVVPGSLRVGARGGRPRPEHRGVVGDLVALAVGRDRSRGAEPRRLRTPPGRGTAGPALVERTLSGRRESVDGRSSVADAHALQGSSDQGHPARCVCWVAGRVGPRPNRNRRCQIPPCVLRRSPTAACCR